MAKSTEKSVPIFDNPAYPASEAARILNLPVATLKAWCFGQAYRSATGPKRFQPVIRPADENARLLSFANLCELHILSAIRRHHKISLPKVRDSVEYVRSQLGATRPLIDRDFRTNGIDLFVEHASKEIATALPSGCFPSAGHLPWLQSNPVPSLSIRAWPSVARFSPKRQCPPR